jgi:hypothetical protein
MVRMEVSSITFTGLSGIDRLRWAAIFDTLVGRFSRSSNVAAAAGNRRESPPITAKTIF